MPKNPPQDLNPARELRLILGDQLNANHPWFSDGNDEVLYVLCELRSETDYAPHHVQKVVAFFAAMRAFAEERVADGHRVHVVTLDDPLNTGNFDSEIVRLRNATGADRLQWQLPDEWRLDQLLADIGRAWRADGGEAMSTDSAHFLTERTDLAQHFKGKKTFLMESFYRMMRRKHNVLMDDHGQPAGGQWNYDATNRKKLPKGHVPPAPLRFDRDVSPIVAILERAGVQTTGRIRPGDFAWPVTRAECLALLNTFVEDLLPRFGDFQDAMTLDSWSVYHSRLSFGLNAKLISPREVIAAVEARWRVDPQHADITQVEGFIRQILGWREYMRGIYWAKMPEYAELNFFGHDRPLPGWFWTGDTRMACLRHAIGQTLEHAYAHHIQRLMVTGNFALLAGVDPDAVDAWYLGVYIDAVEWVEITNTRGMSQFADGGIVGTKPYVASANYMKKMGPYCAGCKYKASEKTGPDSCPFNSLYWHFYDRNRDLLAKNPRIGMAYRTWDKMTPEKRAAILETATHHLNNLESL